MAALPTVVGLIANYWTTSAPRRMFNKVMVVGYSTIVNYDLERHGILQYQVLRKQEITSNVNRKIDSHRIDGSELYRHCIRGCPDHDKFSGKHS